MIQTLFNYFNINIKLKLPPKIKSSTQHLKKAKRRGLRKNPRHQNC